MGRCILVVDDEEVNLTLTEYILRSHSYEVVTASSGAQGLDKLRNRMIDLVLLDICLLYTSDTGGAVGDGCSCRKEIGGRRCSCGCSGASADG